MLIRIEIDVFVAQQLPESYSLPVVLSFFCFPHFLIVGGRPTEALFVRNEPGAGQGSAQAGPTRGTWPWPNDPGDRAARLQTPVA